MSNYYQIDYNDYANKFVPWFMRNQDFEVSEGDFKQADTTEQESYFILKANKGHYRQYIRLGLGLEKYINADIQKNELRRKIRENLEEDNLKINKIYVITENDLRELNIQDADLINSIKQNGFLISLDIER